MFLTYLLAQLPQTAKTTASQVADTAATVADTAAATVPPVVLPSSSVPEMNIWSHILDSDPLVKFTLFLLVGFSVLCWAVIFFKFRQIGAAQKATQSFWSKFSNVSTFADVVGGKGMRHGPLYEIFMSGHETVGKVKKSTRQLTDYHREFIQQRIRQSQQEEMGKLEQYVSFLATTASVAPFIGLFGTVWGILTAFLAIGKAGSSSLATVGPYIAEALVATAVGLFAAIPAVVAYNYFVGKIKNIDGIVDLFIGDFMLKSEREFAS